MIDVLVTAMQDEMAKIAMDDEARKHLVTGLKGAGAAALGTGLGITAGNLLSYYLQRTGRMGPGTVQSVLERAKYPGLIAIPAGLTLGGIGMYAEHKMRAAQKRYAEEQRTKQEDDRSEAHS